MQRRKESCLWRIGRLVLAEGEAEALPSEAAKGEMR